MIKAFVSIFSIFASEERDIYIYHKNEERHDSAFYILASGAIVLTMVLSSNAMCRFTSSPCSHLYHLSMGSNKKYSTKCIVNGTVTAP